MAGYQSAEEVEKEHLAAFGPTLGPLYHALCNDVTWLHAKWLEYRKLYAHSEKRVDLLNDTAPFFFRVVQDVLWEDVLLHIARLTDPPEQGKFENLTLPRLPGAVKDAGLADELRILVRTAEDRSGFARRWRNERLAHRDLSLALRTKASPLPGVSRQDIGNALASFSGIMNRLRAFYLQGEVAFDEFLPQGGADALVRHLAVAAKARED